MPSTSSSRFKHYPNRPSSLNAEFIDQESKRLVASADHAESGGGPDAWSEVIRGWNSLQAYVSGEMNRTQFKQAGDRRDILLEAEEKRLRETVLPHYENCEFEIVSRLLKSRHRGDLEARFGNYFFERMGAQLSSLSPETSELRTRASGRAQDYSKIVAMGEVQIGSEKISVSRAAALIASERPELRKQAYLAHRQWFSERRGELGGLFNEIVGMRQEMATRLGDPTFVPLGYAGMARTDWGVAEATVFRDEVRKNFVPVQTRIQTGQASRLRTERLQPWDMEYDPEFSLPDNVAPVVSQIERSQRVFDRISPKLGAHFKRMREEGLIDLENRPGKQAGAFCTSFPDEGRVAILCNSVGQAADVRTLMHECGHSFQGWESQAIELISLQWPTMEAAEIHSMGMEYLSLRHMDEFFEPSLAKRFRRDRWRQAIQLICYVAIVDEFQHWIYANPMATPDERDHAWDKIWSVYKPSVDFSACPELKSARWYAQLHIFHMPFYYLDYAIAEICAMQLSLMDAEDPKRALEAYLELCKIGGTRGLQGICQAAGMSSPFDPKLLARLAEHAAGEIGV